MAIGDGSELPRLDYAAVRPLLRTGDLILLSSRTKFARAIEWATASPWSHVAFLVRLDAIDRVMMLESVEKIGVRAVALSNLVFGVPGIRPPYDGTIAVARHAGFAQPHPPEALRAFGDFAATRLGAPFSSAEVAKIALRIALHGLGIALPRMALPDDEFICSEYVAACFARLGIAIAWDGKGFIAPVDFAADPEVSGIARIVPPR